MIIIQAAVKGEAKQASNAYAEDVSAYLTICKAFGITRTFVVNVPSVVNGLVLRHDTVENLVAVDVSKFKKADATLARLVQKFKKEKGNTAALFAAFQEGDLQWLVKDDRKATRTLGELGMPETLLDALDLDEDLTFEGVSDDAMFLAARAVAEYIDENLPCNIDAATTFPFAETASAPKKDKTPVIQYDEYGEGTAKHFQEQASVEVEQSLELVALAGLFNKDKLVLEDESLIGTPGVTDNQDGTVTVDVQKLVEDGVTSSEKSCRDLASATTAFEQAGGNLDALLFIISNEPSIRDAAIEALDNGYELPRYAALAAGEEGIAKDALREALNAAKTAAEVIDFGAFRENYGNKVLSDAVSQYKVPLAVKQVIVLAAAAGLKKVKITGNKLDLIPTATDVNSYGTSAVIPNPGKIAEVPPGLRRWVDEYVILGGEAGYLVRAFMKPGVLNSLFEELPFLPEYIDGTNEEAKARGTSDTVESLLLGIESQRGLAALVGILEGLRALSPDAVKER